MNSAKTNASVQIIPSKVSAGIQVTKVPLKPHNVEKSNKAIQQDIKDRLETVRNVPDLIDEPVVKLMTSEMAKNVPAETDDSLVKLDNVNLDR